ncbi:MAG: hypothetical protein IPN08_12350 [Bacteroidales bacterium]|nr:hypothetical protein [Bacteroidales bacterium]
MNLLARKLFRNLNYQDLLPGEKRTFRLHLGYTVFDNFVAGVLTLNEFVFLRSLHGSSYQLSFLFQFSVLVFIFLIFFSEWLKRVRNKQKLIRWVGIATRAPLAVLLFFPRSAEAMSGTSVYHYIFPAAVSHLLPG